MDLMKLVEVLMDHFGNTVGNIVRQALIRKDDTSCNGCRDLLICIGCFEKRLGRRLTRVDFAPWFRNNCWYKNKKKPLNDPPSERLIDRLQLPI